MSGFLFYHAFQLFIFLEIDFREIALSSDDPGALLSPARTLNFSCQNDDGFYRANFPMTEYCFLKTYSNLLNG